MAVRRIGGGGGGVPETAPLLVLALLTCASSQIRAVSAKRLVVGDAEKWNPGVNYTQWASRNRFFVHDWLVFYYQKGNYDVMEVNETAFKNCISDDPIWNYSRGNRYAVELNESRPYYFICGRGYCYQGMKFSITVEPLPKTPPPTSPSPPEGSAAFGLTRGSGGRSVLWASVVLMGVGRVAWDAFLQMV